MQRTQLVTKALATAGRKDGQSGFTFEDFGDDLGLSVSELVEPEDGLEGGKYRRIDGVHNIRTHNK